MFAVHFEIYFLAECISLIYVGNNSLTRLRNDLYCVEWGVKLYSLTHSLTLTIFAYFRILVCYTQAQVVYRSAHKGIMTPPVLLDLTGDGVVDIVFSTYNSTVLAIDGQTFDILWNFTYPLSETYA